MELVWSVITGVLFAAGVYMTLRRSLLKIILGIALLGQSVNLLIFTTGRLVRGSPPLIPETAERLVLPYADPLPQALTLTAIVIGFGVQAFAIVLFKRVYRQTGVDDVDELRTTDEGA